MSNLTVIIFDDTEQAAQVKESLKKQEKQGLIKVDDTAVIVKDADGKAHIDQQFLDSGSKAGAVTGSVLGLVLLGVFAPVLGLVGGAVVGGLLGKFVDRGIDKDFVKEVSDELKPNTSALFITTHDANANAVAAMLRQYEGKVYHTTLDSETEEQLRHALKDKS
jgi:uncharacterized membrane protein